MLSIDRISFPFSDRSCESYMGRTTLVCVQNEQYEISCESFQLPFYSAIFITVGSLMIAIMWIELVLRTFFVPMRSSSADKPYNTEEVLANRFSLSRRGKGIWGVLYQYSPIREDTSTSHLIRYETSCFSQFDR